MISANFVAVNATLGQIQSSGWGGGGIKLRLWTGLYKRVTPTLGFEILGYFEGLDLFSSNTQTTPLSSKSLKTPAASPAPNIPVEPTPQPQGLNEFLDSISFASLTIMRWGDRICRSLTDLFSVFTVSKWIWRGRYAWQGSVRRWGMQKDTTRYLVLCGKNILRWGCFLTLQWWWGRRTALTDETTQLKRYCFPKKGHTQTRQTLTTQVRLLSDDDRILREVFTLSRMQHQYVVRYYSTWIEGLQVITNPSQAFFAEEIIDGVDEGVNPKWPHLSSFLPWPHRWTGFWVSAFWWRIRR